jgi:enamine deaminase RidA (YjgF/YER057c/UK114 family)
MNGRQLISSGAPWEPIFGYSRAVRVGNQVFVAGTVGRNSDGSVPSGAYQPAERALEIIGEALAEAGAGFDHVVRTRIFVTDIAFFDDVARAHGEVFGTIRPASALVEVRRLVEPDYLVEIEADAVVMG